MLFVRKGFLIYGKCIHARSIERSKDMITAVILDMDGVIADSEYLNVKAKHIQLKQAGIDVDWHYHDKFFGTTHEFMWTEMILHWICTGRCCETGY